MRILMLSQVFDPEPNARGLPFARELARRGHEVEVLTGFPNYPGGRVYPGYRIRPWQREIMNGIVVHRVPSYPSHDRSGFRRFATYTSFAISASALGPFVVRKPDVVYVYHPPITLGLPAMMLRMLKRCPFVYDVQDLWPDTVVSCGMMNNRALLAMLTWWCRVVYRQADRIVVLSPGFKNALVSRGVPDGKIDVIYNWADEESIHRVGRNEALAEQLGMAGRFNIVFAGTMGIAQALDSVLEAARLCAPMHKDAQFVFVGGGIDKARIESKSQAMGLTNTRFLPRQPMEAIGDILALADVLLVHLRSDPLFRITIPSKTQAYMAAGRPILMAVPGDAASLVEQAGAGVTCASEEPAALADAVVRLHAMSSVERRAMGVNGKRFFDSQLALTVGVEQFERVFRDAVGEPPRILQLPERRRLAA
jgi:glycosyltransferase involved in cell wall biosynthesis